VAAATIEFMPPLGLRREVFDTWTFREKPNTRPMHAIIIELLATIHNLINSVVMMASTLFI